MYPSDILNLAASVVAAARASGLKVATAESCTGGLVAGALTEIAGSSDVFERGLVTYTNDAKTSVLGVAPALIEEHGAVSEPVARAMAEGALAHSSAQAAVAVTGVAGPGGGSEAKPVGLVHFAVARVGRATVHHEARFGALGRSGVRQESVRQALAMLRDAVS